MLNINDRKMNFILNMSHEVRTPLNSIISMTELLIKKNNNDAYDKLLQIIKVSSLELMEVMNNILDYSKVITNKLQLKYETVSLTQTINLVYLFLESEAKEKGLDFNIKIDSNISDMIITDGARLKQLLTNLISNAIKYTNQGYIELSAELIKTKSESCDILFKIVDTGIGMKHIQIEKIIHYFTKNDHQYLSDKEGLGVGLAIAKHIVELMKGKIWIEENNNDGTIINIVLTFSLYKDDIDYSLVKDYFVNNTALILNPDNRTETIKLFSSYKINPIIAMNIDEIDVYIKSNTTIDFIIINISNLNEEDIGKLNNMIIDTVKIILIDDKREDLDLTLLYDYKITKPITSEKFLDTLAMIYTINTSNLKTIENEIYFDDKKFKLDSFNHNAMDKENIKILIAEDNEYNQKALEHILKFKKFKKIDKAINGEVALKKLYDTDYDLVFMDIKMPVKNGIDVIREYRSVKFDSNTFVVAVTAGISDDIKNKCFQAKFNAFLSKPIDIDSLDKIVALMFKNKV